MYMPRSNLEPVISMMFLPFALRCYIVLPFRQELFLSGRRSLLLDVLSRIRITVDGRKYIEYQITTIMRI